MRRIRRPMIATFLLLAISASLFARGTAPSQPTGAATSTALPSATATVTSSPTAEPSPTPSPTAEPSPTPGIVTQDEDAVPRLLSVTPGPGSTVGLDAQLCATFDVTKDGIPGWWSGPVWFDVAGTEIQQNVHMTSDRSVATGCANYTLRHLFENGSLNSVPTEGPLELAVRHQDQHGEIHRQAWEVEFSLAAPTAPAGVQRVREIYRALQSIDLSLDYREQKLGGYFLKDDALTVYVLSHVEPESIRDEVEAALGESIPAGGLTLKPMGSYEPEQLDEWRHKAHDIVNRDQRINLHGATGSPAGRICCIGQEILGFDFGTVYSVHLFREGLEELPIPQDAIDTDVRAPWQIQEPDDSNGRIQSTLEFEPAAMLGSAIRIDIVWTNTTNETVTHTYSPYLPANLVAFTPGGEDVWASFNGAGVPDVGAELELGPGEEKRFPVYWELVDEDGFALPPGEYLLQAQGWDSPTSDVYPIQIEQ